MAAYAEWRGAAVTRPDVAVSGPKLTEMNLIAIDFVKAGDPAYKDRLVKRWLEKDSRERADQPPPPDQAPRPRRPRGPALPGQPPRGPPLPPRRARAPAD